MEKDTKKERIIFLDLLRAFAVVNMIQGHTIDVLLSNNFRTTESVAYNVWYFNRGITAPIFLFTAGAVFSYIFLRHNHIFHLNPRVQIGIKRALLLLFIGYFIKIPKREFLSFSEKTYKELTHFFSVDVLQLIGVGLLLIIFLFYLSEKLSAKRTLIFLITGFFIILFCPIAEKIDWKEFSPLFIASYFYRGTGSLFPVFPYVVYMLFGGAFGIFLSQNKNYCQTKRFSFSLLIIGTLFILTYLFLDKIRFALNDEFVLMSMRGNITYLRIGIVLIFVALLTIISRDIKSLHWSINLLARNSLSIYVIHLFILYGSAWNKGIISFYGKSVSPINSIIFCIIFIIFLTLFAWVYEKIFELIKSGFNRVT